MILVHIEKTIVTKFDISLLILFSGYIALGIQSQSTTEH